MTPITVTGQQPFELIKFPSYSYCRNWEELIHLGKETVQKSTLRVAAKHLVP